MATRLNLRLYLAWPTISARQRNPIRPSVLAHASDRWRHMMVASGGRDGKICSRADRGVAHNHRIPLGALDPHSRNRPSRQFRSSSVDCGTETTTPLRLGGNISQDGVTDHV